MTTAIDFENQYEGAQRTRGDQPRFGRRKRGEKGADEDEDGKGKEGPPKAAKKSAFGEEQQGSLYDASKLEQLQSEYFGARNQADDDEEVDPERRKIIEGQAEQAAIDQEELIQQIAAPDFTFSGTKAPTLAELDKDREYKLPTTKHDLALDITVLTQALTAGDITETDETWDPGLLFTALASELQQEKEAIVAAQEAVRLALEPSADVEDQKRDEVRRVREREKHRERDRVINNAPVRGDKDKDEKKEKKAPAPAPAAETEPAPEESGES